jgi:diguanylate cyclase (GGDEF)-like protein
MAIGTNEPVFAVIVVGRPGVGSRLTEDRTITLMRPPSALDALGEFASLDETSLPILIVDIDAFPHAEVNTFIRAARHVSPLVCVLAAGVSRPIGISGVDAWIDADSGPREVRAALGLETRGPARPGSEPPSDSDFSSEDAVAPEELLVLRALLASSDVIEPALARVRRAMRGVDVRFDHANSAGQQPEPMRPGEIAVPVAYQARVFGQLRGPDSARAALDRASNWLALSLALQEQHGMLKTAALTDALTGAWNRRYLDGFLSGALARAKRLRHDLSVLMLDIDDFKSFNTRFGHAAGDAVLAELVRMIGSAVRPTDRVCRLGGDEFAIIFDNPDGPRDPASRKTVAIADFAQRFQRLIDEQKFPRLGEKAVGRVSLTAGMATYPWDAADAASLLDFADRLLREAKRQGKSFLTIGSPSP